MNCSPFVIFATCALALSGLRAAPSPETTEQETRTHFLQKAAGWNETTGFERSLVDLDLPDSAPGKHHLDSLETHARLYTGLQRGVNDRRRPAAAARRKALLDVFERRLRLRGGGSASMAMYLRMPAHVEWMIGHADRKTPNPRVMTDDELLRRNLAVYPFDGSIDPGIRREAETVIRQILADFTKIGATLPPEQSNRLRADFLYFFEERWWR